jgi:hypothetical protein
VHPFYGVSGNRIRVTIDSEDPTKEWSLTFDTNWCQLDAFGEVKTTTLMYCFPWQMTLTLLQHDGERKLFSIDAHRKGMGPVEAPEVKYEGPPLRLVTYTEHHHKRPERMRLLVLDDHEHIISIIELPRKD